MKHTPGKWTYRDATENEKLAVHETRFKIECKTDIPGVKGIVASCGYRLNAQAITALPDLLEACKFAFENLKPQGNIKKDFSGHNAMATLSRAITKAEGGNT